MEAKSKGYTMTVADTAKNFLQACAYEKVLTHVVAMCANGKYSLTAIRETLRDNALHHAQHATTSTDPIYDLSEQFYAARCVEIADWIHENN